MLLPWQYATFATLTRSVASGAHALLLTGAAGIGKRVLAEHLAAWRLCEAPATTGACGTCASCHLLAAGNHPDLIVVEPEAEAAVEEGEGIDGAGEPTGRSKAKPSRFIVVGQVRALLDRMALTAHSGAGRVILMASAEQMNVAAANALLKTLEEPPPRTIFILLSAADERLPATVKSRCRRLPLGLPPPDQAQAWLEGQGVSPADALLRLAGGAPLRAQSLLDTDTLDRWKLLTRHLDARRFDPSPWDTSPEGLATLCQLLQMLCVDLQRASAGAAAKYGDASETAVASAGRRLAADRISDLWRELGRARALIQHPLNGSLVRDQLLLGFQRLLAAP